MTNTPDDDPTIRDIDDPAPVPTPAELRRAADVVCRALLACRDRIQTDPRFSPDYVAAATPLFTERAQNSARDLAHWLHVLHPDR